MLRQPYTLNQVLTYIEKDVPFPHQGFRCLAMEVIARPYPAPVASS